MQKLGVWDFGFGGLCGFKILGRLGCAWGLGVLALVVFKHRDRA